LYSIPSIESQVPQDVASNSASIPFQQTFLHSNRFHFVARLYLKSKTFTQSWKEQKMVSWLSSRKPKAEYL
jgi:hypothetical protein